MQKETQSLYITNGKIDALYKLFIQPILRNATGKISETNLKDVEKSIAAMPRKDLHEHLKHCEDHALLTTRELETAKKYVHTIEQSL